MHVRAHRLLVFIFCILWGAFSLDAGDATPEAGLSSGGRALMPVVVGAQAGDAVKASAAELARYLGRMGGASFVVETGDGCRGIALGRPADFTALPFPVKFKAGPFDRETYVIRSHGRGLCLLGATDLAISHAVWDLLHRLGHRQFFPGETWEVVPPPRDLRVAMHVRQRPSFYARRIWYNWGLWDYNGEPYRQWCVRNRAVKGFDLNSGHSYGGIIAANRAAFDAHPEFLALIDGKRRIRGGDLKFCIANPDLRALVVRHAVRFFKGHPRADSISMDPSDGGHWCQCEGCTRMGPISNRVLALANQVAEGINDLGLGPKYVGMYAYNRHSTPPTIRAHPNVIVSATTAFIRGGFTFDQVVRGWQSQGATIGVYDYLSVIAWDWNQPRAAKGSRPRAVAESLARFHGQGARFYDAESGDCWGPCGLGYYIAGRVMWDVREAKRVDALVDDFLAKAFGKAREPMREFYRLINFDAQRRPMSDLLGRMYRQLDAARRVSGNPAVLKRIDDLILYARYAELYDAFKSGSGRKEDVIRHAHRMRKTMMVHTYGLWARMVSQRAAHAMDHPLKSEAPFARQELDGFLAEGIAKHPPVEPGFEGIGFSRNLVPATPLKLPSVSPGKFPGVPQDRQHYYIWMPEGAGHVDLKVTIQKVWANRMPRISLFSPKEVSLQAVAIDERCRPDGKTCAVRLKTPYTGLHRLETLDGGDYTRIQWPDGMPVTIASGIDTPHVTTHFRGAWTMYFYVPKGTRVIGGWASRIASWAPRISGLLKDPAGRVALDFGKVEEGWFKVPVPDGLDGRLWQFANSQGQRLLMTVPPFLACTAEALLLPAEVVAADR